MRVMLAELDSLVQADLESLCDMPPATHHHPAMPTVEGVLRLGSLLCETVVITDTQLLDGTGLLRMGPDGVEGLLGHRARSVEIRGRAADLESCLKDLIIDGAGQPRAFRWSSLRESESMEWSPRAVASGRTDQLAHECAGATGSQLIQLLSDYLVELGLDTDAARNLCARWTSWAEAVREQRFHFVQWEGSLELRAAFEFEPPSDLTSLLTSKDAHAMAEQLCGVDRRSDARRLLLGSDLPEPDQSLLLDWWNSAYQRAIATQHDAELLQFMTSSVRSQRMSSRDSRHGLDRIPVRASDAFMHQVTTMPTAVYDLCSYRSRRARSEMAQSPGPSTDRLIVAVHRVCQEDDPQLDRWSARRALFVLIGAGVLTLAGKLAGPWLFALVVALVLIEAWPIAVEHRRLRRSSLRAVLEISP